MKLIFFLKSSQFLPFRIILLNTMLQGSKVECGRLDIRLLLVPSLWLQSGQRVCWRSEQRDSLAVNVQQTLLTFKKVWHVASPLLCKNDNIVTDSTLRSARLKNLNSFLQCLFVGFQTYTGIVKNEAIHTRL